MAETSLRRTSLHRTIIVGAGPAGMRCAERLAGRGLAVTLIGAEAELPYNRVALSKFLAGEIAVPDLITHDDAVLKEARITYLPGTRVTAIDREAGRVLTDLHGPMAYGHLVLALGSQPVRLPFPGANLPGVVMYRTLDDVNAMLAAAEAGGDAIVIGGGLLGLEAAYGLARRGMKVSVLHAVDRLMERQLDHAAAALLMRRMAEYRIDTYLTAKTEIIEGDGHVTSVRLADGTIIPATLVVMAVGIRPETTLAREAGLTVARGIVVDDAMRTSDPAILAIGECAEHQGACCGLVAPAFAQAETCARVIAGATIAYVAQADATALKVAGAGVWSAGAIDADGAEEIVFSDTEAGEYRKLLLRDDRLVGAMLYGETGDANWYQSLIADGTPIDSLRAALPFGPAFAEVNP
jgi:nitrite reductase (NADH) large subunit